MKNFIKKVFNSLSILLFFTNLAQGQFNIPEPPKKIYPVNDYAGVLSNIQIEKLNRKLIQYSKTTSTEILISIVQDIYGEDPNFLASKWGEKWNIGKKDKNNGIVILLSINDKKISIQNGYGIEPYLTDFSTQYIIKKIKPLLKNNLYYKAIDIGIKEIFKILKNKYEYKKKHNKNPFYIWNFFIPISIFFIMFFLFQKKGIEPSLLNTLFLTYFLFKDRPTKNQHDHENEDNFDGFGEGGSFGGGGSSGNW
ncbi:TPM domain-containing protein [Blattabacterium sp. (Cryptocercus kyebangensis)]|uniref:TPM domain-containing protein n=1 Tax=Blattabacterium sp. (Cryptocercus kyebangensis) TaxID=298656 RepID=UPI000D7CEEDF|nr:TPM domain-containing protein [Blattabacterium sp. (Cryptocercus kyebangensis)]AWU43841.1 TPM domain-containing protein [Blattabacterium sp. (Cryptocercus kyebangensis)]